MRRELTHKQVARLATKCIAGGGLRLSRFRFEWNIAGRCEKPATFDLIGRQTVDQIHETPKHALMLTMHTKCRQCPTCLAQRQYTWRKRAIAEFGYAARSWFGTLTLAPEKHFLALSETRTRLARSGVDHDALPEKEQFRELLKTLGRQITLYLKRIRKVSGAELRYILVAELHKSGVPHFHLLLHEIDPEKPVRHSTLSSEWTMGFEQFRLVKDAKVCSYIAKYLNKGQLARVRASLNYGEPTKAHKRPVS